MKKWTERHHAYIAAAFYKAAKERSLRNYREAFIKAVQFAAEQRGRRMALRALRDGYSLDYAAYRRYGEWAPTDCWSCEGGYERALEQRNTDTDYGYAITSCPWADVFIEEGLKEDGGPDYCSDLDPSIVRGFNPKLTYIHRPGLYSGGKCIQFQKDGMQAQSLPPKNPDDIRDFAYQCGCLYKAFYTVFTSVYGNAGEEASKAVLKKIAEKWGDEYSELLLHHLQTDFERI